MDPLATVSSHTVWNVNANNMRFRFFFYRAQLCCNLFVEARVREIQELRRFQWMKKEWIFIKRLCRPFIVNTGFFFFCRTHKPIVGRVFKSRSFAAREEPNIPPKITWNLIQLNSVVSVSFHYHRLNHDHCSLICGFSGLLIMSKTDSLRRITVNWQWFCRIATPSTFSAPFTFTCFISQIAITVVIHVYAIFWMLTDGAFLWPQSATHSSASKMDQREVFSCDGGLFFQPTFTRDIKKWFILVLIDAFCVLVPVWVKWMACAHTNKFVQKNKCV